jgi:hypothetical protein
VILFGGPGLALDLTLGLHAKAGKPGLHAGLNFGPLALAARGSEVRVVGDGLASAMTAARFASPEKILVTKDFAAALGEASPQRAGELDAAGEFTDTRVRLHSFYTPSVHKARSRRAALVRYAVAGVVGILLLGVAGRAGYRRVFPPSPAIVKLEVKPRGEVFVDGVSQGQSPPLSQVEIPAGRHVIQVRSPGYAPLELNLNLSAGEQATVTHTFGKSDPKSISSYWRDLKRRLGGS